MKKKIKKKPDRRISNNLKRAPLKTCVMSHMDQSRSIHDALFQTPLWRVLDYMLQYSDKELGDVEILTGVRTIKKSAVIHALRRLVKIGFVTRRFRRSQAFNSLCDSPLINHLRAINNIVAIKELVEKMAPGCSKIIMYGRRADGTNGAESEFNLFAVATNEAALKRIVRKHPLADKVQLIVRKPSQMLTFVFDAPGLQRQVQKGTVLWEALSERAAARGEMNRFAAVPRELEGWFALRQLRQVPA